MDGSYWMITFLRIIPLRFRPRKCMQMFIQKKRQKKAITSDVCICEDHFPTIPSLASFLLCDFAWPCETMRSQLASAWIRSLIIMLVLCGHDDLVSFCWEEKKESPGQSITNNGSVPTQCTPAAKDVIGTSHLFFYFLFLLPWHRPQGAWIEP
jgi:hypothetical protein